MLEGPEPATLVPYIGQVCTIVWKPSLTGVTCHGTSFTW